MNLLKSIKFEYKLYAYVFCSWNLPIIAFFTLMFHEARLSAFQIAIAYSCSSIARILFEVPSGAIADKFSRKKVLLIGNLINAVALAALLITKSFVMLMISNIAWGIVLAINSGTLEAFIYDELKAEDREGTYPKVISRNFASISAGLGCSFILSAIFVKYGYDLLILMSLVSLTVAFLILLCIKEAARQKLIAPTQAYFAILQKGVKCTLQHPIILRLTLFSALFAAVITVTQEFFSVFATQAGWGKHSIAMLIAAQVFCEMIMGLISSKFNFLTNRQIAALGAVGSVVFIAASWFINALSPIFVWGIFIVNVLRIVVLLPRKQQFIPSELRATILSAEGFFQEFTQIAIRIPFSLIAVSMSYTKGFILIGTVGLLICGIFSIFVNFNTSGSGVVLDSAKS